MIDRRPLGHANGLIALGFALGVVLWFAVSRLACVSAVLLPSPGQVFEEFVRLCDKGVLLRYTVDSLWRVAGGWGCGVLLALPVGLLLGASRRGAAFFHPVVLVARYLPVAALLPLTMVYFGTGTLQKSALVFLGVFFHLVLSFMQDVRRVPQDYLRAGLSLGVGRLRLFREVLLPAALPGLLESLRVSLGWAWGCLVMAELVASDSGLGYMIIDARRQWATDRMFVGILVIGLLVGLADFFFRMLVDLLLPWREEDP